MTRNKRDALIIGGSGFLGSAIVEAATDRLDLFETHRSRASRRASIRFDLLKDNPEELLDKVDPQLVILAAHIEPALNERSAQKRARSFVQRCSNRRLVYISSDAVFDGRKGLYSENDPVSSKQVYGKGLAFMEATVREVCSDHVIVRPSYLFGFSMGRLDLRLASTRDRLLQGKNVSFFSDMFNSPLEANEAAAIILDIEAMQFAGTVHVAGPRMSVFDFRCQAMRALGLPIHQVLAERMPTDSGLLQDTSLSIERMLKLTGKPPKSSSTDANNNPWLMPLPGSVAANRRCRAS